METKVPQRASPRPSPGGVLLAHHPPLEVHLSLADQSSSPLNTSHLGLQPQLVSVTWFAHHPQGMCVVRQLPKGTSLVPRRTGLSSDPSSPGHQLPARSDFPGPPHCTHREDTCSKAGGMPAAQKGSATTRGVTDHGASSQPVREWGHLGLSYGDTSHPFCEPR